MCEASHKYNVSRKHVQEMREYFWGGLKPYKK